MSCNDCIHCEACNRLATGYNIMQVKTCVCKCFSDKAKWIHLPVEVGEQVFVIYADEIQHTSVSHMKIASEDDHFDFILNCMVSQGGARFENFVFGKTAFLTREKAQKQLISGERY